MRIRTGALTHALGAVAIGVIVVLPSLDAHAQTAPPAAAERHESTRQTLNKVASQHEELAKLIDPATYGPAFVIGAQAEFVAPAVGVSSVVFGYDAVFMQIEGDLGMLVGGSALTNTDATHTYSFDMRLAVPVHRGVRADFSLMAGGGAFVIDPPQGSTFVLGTALLGARLRAFYSPNVALLAGLGVQTVIRGDHTEVGLGARPLGSAGVVYFFR
jgi:hypothetical protein